MKGSKSAPKPAVEDKKESESTSSSTSSSSTSSTPTPTPTPATATKISEDWVVVNPLSTTENKETEAIAAAASESEIKGVEPEPVAESEPEPVVPGDFKSEARAKLASLEADLHRLEDFKDPSSFSSLHAHVTRHIHLDLTADFDRKVLHGTAELTVETLMDGVRALVLDSRDLKVQQVTIDGQPRLYQFDAYNETFGSALRIMLPPTLRKKGKHFKVLIEYKTDPGAPAIQWLEPAQTAGKMHPYLFTQCQAIHARSLLPCQDAPMVKCGYTARLTVPAPLVALMSALSTGVETEVNPAVVNPRSQQITYLFEQKVPTPSYLIAIAIGALKSHRLSEEPSCAVWSEAETLDAAVWEFPDTPEFVNIGTKLCGPYVWGKYDLLVLPPSFPYGGMENPCLTFVTPTLIAGDRSLQDVVAHEISHSWMGNLVTCRTWVHFWLNEGFTMYLERRISEAMHGVQASDLHAHLGQTSLKGYITSTGLEHNFTRMCPDLAGVDPDDAFSIIPYEKGYTFIRYLESLVGYDVMTLYLRAHCDHFGFGNLTSESFQAFFTAFVAEQAGVASNALDEVDWKTWFYAPGMPPVFPSLDASLVEVAQQAAAGVLSVPARPLGDISKWPTQQTCAMLDSLKSSLADASPESKGSQAALQALDAECKFSKSGNSEILFRFLILALRSRLSDYYPLAANMATRQGRMKFTRPLYRELFAADPDLAVATFQANKDTYHSICRKMVARDLKLA